MVVRPLGGIGTYGCQDAGRNWHLLLSGCWEVLALMIVRTMGGVGNYGCQDAGRYGHL